MLEKMRQMLQVCCGRVVWPNSHCYWLEDAMDLYKRRASKA